MQADGTPSGDTMRFKSPIAIRTCNRRHRHPGVGRRVGTRHPRGGARLMRWLPRLWRCHHPSPSPSLVVPSAGAQPIWLWERPRWSGPHPGLNLSLDPAERTGAQLPRRRKVPGRNPPFQRASRFLDAPQDHTFGQKKKRRHMLRRIMGYYTIACNLFIIVWSCHQGRDENT